ncbi:hypothetical protein TL16_g12661 [Triparma laevis f. inornata]|uniref:Uncharacterized protein n=1 Tax=Triparma laevis f. inornata TaxID=1714386 RepID=A0A9W7BS50_9STRA|nr:hypothetical protein TL16_g12661 [Triparma laevis f. inornata]
MPTHFDISQKRPDETDEQYWKRPLFPQPGFTTVISRHQGSVLNGEPHVHLTPTEEKEFTKEWENITKGETMLPLSKFSDLLSKLRIKLSKDLYIRLVDEHLADLNIEEEMTEAQCKELYCKVYAAPVKHGPRLRKACGRNDLEVVTELIQRGCDINTADGNGHTPLHHATFHGICKDTIKLLNDLSGKDGVAKLVVDAKDNRGWTPLMCAASNGFMDTCRALINCHADVKEENLEGRNALHVACGKGMDKIVKMLLSDSGSALINAQSERGWTPMYDACLHSHEEIIKMLLKAGAKTDMKDMLGFTCNHYVDSDVWSKCQKAVE